MELLRRLKLTVEYDGAPFVGWQRQARGRSVQGELESSLAKVLGEPVTVYGAGRTDAGVHALGMVAHIVTSNPIPARKLPLALAAWLPLGIAIIDVTEADPEFDARRDALLRWYRYQIDLGGRRRALGPRAWRLFGEVDIAKIGEAIGLLQGDHDFSGFRAVGCEVERTRLTMRQASMIQSGSLLIIDFKAQSFLQRMVRLMVGAAVGVGTGRFTIDDFIQIRDTGRRPDTVRAAPAEGLCLMRIAYTAEEAENILTARPPGPSF